MIEQSAPGPTRRQWLAGLAAAVAFGPGAARASAPPVGTVLPFDLPPAAERAGSPRKVLAHWFYFPRSFDNKPYPVDSYSRDYMSPSGFGGKYRQAGGFILERPLPRRSLASPDWLAEDLLTDVIEASAIGIDGFQMNIAHISDDFYGWQHFLAAQRAVLRAGLPFRLVINFDCTAASSKKVLETYPRQIVAAFRRGGLMTTDDGRLVLSAFLAEAWPVAFWRELFDGIRRLGTDIYFVPMFLSVRDITPEYLALADTVSFWSANRVGAVQAFAVYRGVKFGGKPWMSPVVPQDCRPKDGWFAEAGGSAVFRSGWEGTIGLGASMASIVTWNDYSESSEIRPSTGIQYGYYDLAAYYIAWYKTGAPPPIRRDALYYFHRIQPASGDAFGTAQSKPMTMKYGPGPLDEIELVAFLAKAGTLEIRTSAGVVSQDVKDGLQIIRAPLAPGRPRFRLVRDGATVIDLESAFTVQTGSRYQDLLYRSGSSNRAPVEDLALGRD
jgi:hypothetical protein